MSVREIAGHVRELYGVEVSPDLISAVTDAVLDELAAWQARPLEAVYPLIYFDALRVRSATRARSGTRLSASRSASASMARRKSSASGSNRTRAQSSGSGS